MNLDSLRTLFKDKEKPFLMRLLLLFCLGVAILVASTFLDSFKTGNGSENLISNEKPDSYAAISDNYERTLEKRLSEVLSLVHGAGNVEVMLTLSYSSEIILAEDLTSNEVFVKEVDSAGGTRENHTLIKDMRTILVQSPGGGQEPIILREIVPKVEGVIIVSEGGDDIFVKEALINAAKTVLGVDIHKVQVLKMK